MTSSNTLTMAQIFQPTQAVKEENARRRRLRDRKQLANKAYSSEDWRQPGLNVDAAYDAATVKPMAWIDVLRRRAAGMSPHYRGDPDVASNRSANIPDSENTSLWVTRLPRHCTSYHILMEMLKGRGKIYAASISPPTSDFGTGAATITFFRHIDAENVMHAINTGTLRAPAEDPRLERSIDEGGIGLETTYVEEEQPALEWRQRSPATPRANEGILVDLDDDDTPTPTTTPSSGSHSSVATAITTHTSPRTPRPSPRLRGDSSLLPGVASSSYGRSISASASINGTGKLRACWNRVRVAEPRLRHQNMRRSRGRLQMPSRVIHVSGPAADVNDVALERFFSSKFRYNLDCVVFHGIDSDDGFAEYEFRFACWKNQAEFAAMALRREKPHVRCWYGIDPCEVVEEPAPVIPKKRWIADESAGVFIEVGGD